MSRSRRFRRGIYLLPTIFTIGNLFCGFYALVLTFRGDFERAALMIIVAGVLDVNRIHCPGIKRLPFA